MFGLKNVQAAGLRGSSLCRSPSRGYNGYRVFGNRLKVEKAKVSRLLQLSWLVLMVLLPAGCSLLAPLPGPVTIDQRLAGLPSRDLPLEGEVVIHWNANLVPFIEARTDGDAAFALGMVHAHLRWGQMEIMRRVVQGRLAGMVGPMAVDIDHAIRLLDLAGAAAATEERLHPATRLWLERFAAGVNAYAARATERPFEFRVLGIEPEPWTVRDLLVTGRLFAADVNWFTMFSLLPLMDDPRWERIWRRTLDNGAASIPSYRARDSSDEKRLILARLLRGMSRSGSNAAAVAPEKTAHGAALLAGDSHLGISLPNTWLIAGLVSPSYHMAGLMLPGAPFVAVGRNTDIAWGGTNMRAASSDLVSLAGEPENGLETRTEKVAVRWWFDARLTLRHSRFGPVLSDAPPLKWSGPPFALRWVGHRPSDEIGAFLAAGRAADWASFRLAFQNYAVSSQNMLYADEGGNIGLLPAARLPRRSYTRPPGLILDPGDPATGWQGLVNPPDLPSTFNPESGFIASANNTPYRHVPGRDNAPPVGFFFQSNDRIERLNRLLAPARDVDVDFMKRLHLDVTSDGARELRDFIVGRMAGAADSWPADDPRTALLARIRDWDGAYGADSSGAAAFQILLAHLGPAFYKPRWGEDLTAGLMARPGLERTLLNDMRTAPRAEADRALALAWPPASTRASEVESWGRIHRLRLGHLLANAPVIGHRFQAFDHPASGSYSSLMKTAHTCTDQVHGTTYGSQARYIFSMADPDANWFLLLGGQDGRPGSPAWIDQARLWEAGEYIRVPLRLQTVRREFGFKTVLKPGG